MATSSEQTPQTSTNPSAGHGNSSAPRILMMVGNDIRHDTRVLKTALALADGGAQVTILGYSSSGHREESRLGPVRIVRVPVAWRLRDAAARHQKDRARRRTSLAVDPADRRLVDLRANLRAKEAAELGGADRHLRARTAAAVRDVARLRGRLDRTVGTFETRARGWLIRKTAATALGADWRRIVPEMDDYELAFAPVIDKLDWEIIHAHDVHMVGIASRAVARRRATGRDARWVYDAHEFVAGLSVYPPRTPRKIAAYVDLESEYVRDAAAVITVTEPLADELRRRYDLPTRPAVVMNSPVLGEADRPVERGIRDACGLTPEDPLLVYSGGVTVARGIDTAVDALPDLPGVHLAVVCVPHKEVGPATQLAARAEKLGCRDRLHLLDPVRPDQVSAFVASADVGIIPLRHFGSHEVALANKLFEYLYAGLPVLVSDCRAQADFVRRHDVGDVHEAESPASFARGVQAVLARRDELRRTIANAPDLLEPYAWEHQEVALRDVYRELLGPVITEPAVASTLDGLEERPADRSDRDPVIGIGPANMAGQAWAWGKALERNVPGVTTRVMVVDRNLPILFPADEVVPAKRYTSDPRWAQAYEAAALEGWTHALLEAGRPLFGLRHGKTFAGDVEVLRSVGVGVGLLFHGSEVRDPSLHVHSTPWSPFRDPEEELTARLQTQRDALWPQIQDFLDRDLGPVFVSTPDLLPHVPGARLLPVVVDVDAWAGGRPLLERDVPVVLHAPSRSSLKGTALIDDTVRRLADEGVVEYRRVEGVSPADMPALVKDADIVLDQFSLGIYGVAACEAMAAGRLVVSHVSPDTRSRCPEELPILECTADRLEERLREVADDRSAARDLAARGQEYVRRHHDGRTSAAVLADALGLHRP